MNMHFDIQSRFIFHYIVHINSYIMFHSGWYTEQFTLKPQMNLMCIPQRKQMSESLLLALQIVQHSLMQRETYRSLQEYNKK